MTNLILDQTYTLTGQDIYLCQSTQAGLALRDLNRSRVWRDAYGNPSGFVSGYLVEGNRLSHYAYDIDRGQRTRRTGPTSTGHKEDELQPCGARAHTWDANEWWASQRGGTSHRNKPRPASERPQGEQDALDWSGA